MSRQVILSTSAWDAEGIRRYLQDVVIPVRLACLSGGGGPLICSLWYFYDDGAIWCATQRNARVLTLLQKDARCGFEVAGDLPPYRGVRGQGDAVLSVSDGAAVLVRLIDRYLHGRESRFAHWLISRQEDEVAIRIEPQWLTSWDYTTRMGN